MKSILDRSFRYTPAAQSTPERLRAKFRKLIAEQQAERARDEQEAMQKVAKIKHAAR